MEWAVREERMKLAFLIICALIALLIKLALIGGIVWVAVHFIVKYW